nr:hypothetical protein [Streptomyces sp. alain-838]
MTDAINAEIKQLGVEPVSPGLAELASSLARSVDEADAPTPGRSPRESCVP